MQHICKQNDVSCLKNANPVDILGDLEWFGYVFKQLSRQMPKVVKLAKRIFRENHLEGDVFLCSEAPRKGICFFC